MGAYVFRLFREGGTEKRERSKRRRVFWGFLRASKKRDKKRRAVIF
jgi:hypothetical protein